ncbi:MAG TPA: TonB-dependent siderophore receptor [Steroidobacteraceae bacterium]|nr:TonB-dependent siderophore receptor [Steroidobacteraceae bacterium]
MRFKTALLSLACLWGTLGIQTSVSAETDTAKDPKTLQTIRVEATAEATSTAAKLPLSLRETPQSVTIVTRERLDDQNLLSLQDVLESTPGVYTYAWDSERVVFTSRGFVIDNLMYDGVPAEGNFSTGSIDETIDTALYDRIEIVRGATGLMTGAGSPAASINLFRKHADNKDLATSLGFTAGSWSEYRLDADVSTPLTSDGSVRARFVGVYQDTDSFQNLYTKEKTVLYGIVDADLSENSRLSFGVDFQDNKPKSNTWGSFPLYLADGTPANWARSVTTSTDWAFWNRKTTSAFAELQHSFDNGWSLRSTLSWRRFEEDLALFYVYGFPDPETGEGLEPFAYRADGEITSLALDVHASGAVNLFGREHELVVGYNGSKADNTGNEYANGELPPVGNFFEWDGSYPEPVFDPTPILLTDVDSKQNGLYVAGRFVLADPLKAIAGVRYSTWETDHFYLYDSPDETFHDEYRKVIPYAGLIFDISEHYSVFASFTEIFKPQLALDENAKYLDPVDGNSVEFGIKGEHFDARLNTALTLFETKQDNVAVPAFDEDGAPIPVPGHAGVQASLAVDGTRTRGFEFEASGALGESWNASLGWTRYLIEDAEGIAIRTFVPRTMVRGFTTWRPAALEKLTLGAGINWQSDSYTLVGIPDGLATLREGDVTQLSLMARYQFTPKISVQLNGSNLLDEDYYVLDDYDNTRYGEPLAVSASLNWQF